MVTRRKKATNYVSHWEILARCHWSPSLSISVFELILRRVHWQAAVIARILVEQCCLTSFPRLLFFLWRRKEHQCQWDERLERTASITACLTFLMAPILKKRKHNKCNKKSIRNNEWIRQDFINSPMIVTICHDHTEEKICEDTTILTGVQKLSVI